MNGASIQHYYLEDPVTMQRHKMITSPAQFQEGVRSGSVVKVSGSFMEDGEVYASSVSLHESSNNREGMHGLSMTYPSTGMKLALVLPDFSACGALPPVVNATTLSSYIFEASNPNGYSVGMQLRACSHGNYTIDYANSAVLKYAVPAANCTGSSGSYTASPFSCPTYWGVLTNDLRALAIAAGYNWDFYTNHWMFIPQSWGCKFGGLGWVGIDGLWVPDIYAKYTQTILHEFGHNFGMNHASTYYPNGTAVEYGDRSAMMGGSMDVCYSTANRETANWQTVPTINMTSLTLGLWTNFSILAQDKYENQGLKIVTFLQRDGSIKGNNVSYYLEFRRVTPWLDLKRNQTVKSNQTVPQGGDLRFDPSSTGVVLHFYPNPHANASILGGADWTSYEGNLSLIEGRYISDMNRTGLHFRIRQNNTNNNQSDYALLEICRCAIGQKMDSCCSYPPAATSTPSPSPSSTSRTNGGGGGDNGNGNGNGNGNSNGGGGKSNTVSIAVGASCGVALIGAAAAVVVVKKRKGTLPAFAMTSTK
eukprot:TRINITY_DN2043_c0_g1_i1.p1 TRINITY_DN2043_c0_g1~~TRINITY_DN2043_c0_g1_i1.p1  ORF type:complete len:581 (-),score=120.64 TRINITY_DN2043_c0_g1_i1:144-1745(-)